VVAGQSRLAKKNQEPLDVPMHIPNRKQSHSRRRAFRSAQTRRAIARTDISCAP
jgi:hypothetical protein